MHIIILCNTSLIFGTIASIYVFFTKKNKFIKSCELTLNWFELFQVYTLRSIHYSIFAFLLLYPFVSVIKLTYDLAVICFIVSIYFTLANIWRLYFNNNGKAHFVL